MLVSELIMNSGSNSSFVAIDFETADHLPDSACALGVVKVRHGEIVAREYFLIRPPRPRVLFTWVHGIRWQDVQDQPPFAELWPRFRHLFDDVDFIAAHNASFDRRVLLACCQAGGFEAPAKGFICTVKLARDVWSLYPTKLPDVCRHLGIQLNHHQALSDAEACARIVMAAHRGT